MDPAKRSADRRSAILAFALLLGLHLLLIGAGFALRTVVLSTWQKGPLVDPAAPYAPENALLLFPIAACVALDTYLLVLAVGWRRLQRRWWLPLVAMAVACGASEGALRAWSARAMTTWFRPHPTLHWVVRSDLQDYDHGTGNTPVTTNGDGFREGPAEVAKPPGEYRILVLGDSSNFAQGVTGTEMWEHQLQLLLEPQISGSSYSSVRVINAACPGWTTYQGVELMRGVGADYAPDLVIAGFNNDPGPEVMSDAGRAGTKAWLAPVNNLLFQSEAWLITREAVLAAIRRFSPEAQATYAQRRAGAKPTYGELGEERSRELVARVPLDAYLDNLRTLQDMGEAQGWDTVWLNMPVNRMEPEFVGRYVDWTYRADTFALGEQIDLPILDIDGRWVRSRESGLHITGHVFHPNATGHRRLAEQVADELLSRGLIPGLTGRSPIAGPPIADGEPDLRLGWSSLTPVHAHVGAVLAEHPELATKHGLVLKDLSYERGGPQGDDVAKGALDAWFSCEVPAIHMMQSRPDARIVASPGVLGRIAVVGAAGSSLADLAGQKVGVAPGSTPDMDWRRWSQGMRVETVPLSTEELEPALAAGRVQAIVGWDPWVQQWLENGAGQRAILQERPFHSVLALGGMWSISDQTGRRPTAQDPPKRGRRAVALIEDALRIAAADRPHYDAKVAELSGWPLSVVRAVADQNALLSGLPGASLDLDPTVRQGLDVTARSIGRDDASRCRLADCWAHAPGSARGWAGGQGRHPPGKGPPKHPPGRVAPVPFSPARAPRRQGTPMKAETAAGRRRRLPAGIHWACTWSRSQAAPETYVLTPYIEVVPGAAPLEAESAARLQAELKGPVDARNIKHGYAWIGSTLSLQDLVSGIADLDRAGLPLDADQQAELKPLVQDTRARFGEMMAVQREILDGEAELDAALAGVIAALPPERQAEVQARWKQHSGSEVRRHPGGPGGPPPTGAP